MSDESSAPVDNRQNVGRDDEENSKEDDKTNIQEDDPGASNKECNSVDHVEVPSENSEEVDFIAGTENKGSAMAPTEELGASLSCSSADILEQSTSTGDGIATNIDGAKTVFDSLERTSGNVAEMLSRKTYKRMYNSAKNIFSSDEEEVSNFNKVKQSRNTGGSSAFSTLAGEQASSEGAIDREIGSSSQNVEPLVESERSEILNPSTLVNENAVGGAEIEAKSEMPETPASPSPNEEDTITSPANDQASSSEGESAAEGEDSSAPASSSEADNDVDADNDDNESSDGSGVSTSAMLRPATTFNRILFISSSSSDSDEGSRYQAMLDPMSVIQQVETLHDVLNKPKPSYTWNSTYELRQREHGLRGIGRSSLRNGIAYGFNSRFYASRHVIERMIFSHNLKCHTGHVNCLDFNRSGDLLCAASDDRHVNLWDWAHEKVKIGFHSGHKSNQIQIKFLEGTNCQGFKFITAGRDREVRQIIVPPSGGTVDSVCLYKHRGPVYGLVISPQSYNEIVTVGEEGYIHQHDLRKMTQVPSLLKIVKIGERRLRLFGIAHHPFKPEIAVCGSDCFIRIYDRRQTNNTVYEMCPKHLSDTSVQSTCCVYNSTGSEVLATYSNDQIYIFNNRVYRKGLYSHQYRGHFNNKGIKGVNYFGPNSEYVISGSDCGNIFFWDKNTEIILNCTPLDSSGMINCLETHPSVPILATSGLDCNAKIWAPNSEFYPPDLSQLSDRVNLNLRKSLTEKNIDKVRSFTFFFTSLAPNYD